MPCSNPAARRKIVFTIVSALCLSATNRSNAEIPSGKGYSLDLKTYSIQTIPFARYEIPAGKNPSKIIFAEYAEEAKTIYPAPNDKILADAADRIKKCRADLEANIETIINAQQENAGIKNYLSDGSKIPLFKKTDYLRLIDNPREQTVQIAPTGDYIIAEFRSKEITVEKDRLFCIYITFIYDIEFEYAANKIIISAVRLTMKV